jgi:hypothetical protein
MNDARQEDILTDMIKSKGRKYLYHFTRVRNLPAMAHFDALMSSKYLNPELVGERRTEAREVNFQNYAVTINSHLRIHASMFDPAITQEQFRDCLDRHVFFWPTLRDVQKMLDTYTRREPTEGFAVLQCEAYPLLMAHYANVKLSKYDSGSSPRFPGNSTYKKSPEILLPIENFKRTLRSNVPTKASEIKEILVEERVSHVSEYLSAIYVKNKSDLPDRWTDLAKSITEITPQK